MTDKEMMKAYLRHIELEKMNNMGCGPIVAVVVVVILMLCGCKSVQYVPVETIRKEVVHKTDTIYKKDSVKSEKETIIREGRPEDSIMLKKLGIKLQDNERLLVLLQKELSEAKSESSEIHYKDSIRTDSIQVPYPVEKKLTKWQSFCIDYGKVMLGATIGLIILLSIFIIIWLRKKQMKKD